MKLARMIVAGGLATVLTLGSPVRAEEPTGVKLEGNKELLNDDHQAADKPVVKPPAAKQAAQANISPEAKAELAKVTQAYKALSSLNVEGTVTADISVGGQVENNRSSFAGTFEAPNKFRHEMKGDIIVGSTGEKVYAFRPARNDFKTADAPKERVASQKFPNPMRDVLQMQNVGLMCALVDDAGAFLAEGVKDVTKGSDAMIGGKPCTVLSFKGDKMAYRVMLDPQSHLVRQVVMDLKQSIQASGRDDVERAWLTTDYTKVEPGAKVEQTIFAWAAPQGAKDVAAVDAEEADATALVGKDAPDFTLNGMDNKPVVLAEQKGSVVVLDFWATWCGPCRASLPGLNKIYKELREKGLKVYAVDLEESREKIQPVAAQLIPDLTVLLDEKSEVAKKFGVSGIPQTVVIGKDGKVKKVFVGSGNEAKIKAAVEAGLGE
jgi:thiol-disulfide isomerase/thioredoxin